MERGERRTDDDIIAAEIEKARDEQREVTDTVARMIASQYHDGQASAFYSFASSGAIDIPRMVDELLDSYRDPRSSDADKLKLDILGTYLQSAPGVVNGTRGPITGWSESTSWNHQTMPETVDESWARPEIYVQCVAASEAGTHYGEWVDFSLELEQIQEAIDYMLSRSPVAGSTEYLLGSGHGWYGIDVNEIDDIEQLHKIAKQLEEHGEEFAAYIEIYGHYGLDEMIELFSERYLGTYDSMDDYVEHVLQETGAYEVLEDIPLADDIKQYVRFDLEAIGMHWRYSSSIHIAHREDGKVMIYNNQ